MGTDAITSYTYSSAIWLSLQATPLLLTPKLITALLAIEARKPTDLEIYFSRSLSLTLFTLALVTLILTGALPLTTTSISTSQSDPAQPSSHIHSLAMPTLTLTTAFHASTAFYAYMQYTNTSQLAFGLGMVGSGGLAAMGVWCLLFGNGEERASGWPFRNAEARRLKEERRRDKRAGWGKKGL